MSSLVSQASRVVEVLAPVASVAATAYGMYNDIENAGAEGEYANMIAEQNASIMEADAAEARRQAKVAADQKRKEVGLLLSRQRGLYTKSGVTMAGSPLTVQDESYTEGEKDVLALLAGGEASARGYMSRANIFREQGAAALDRAEGRTGGTILTGLANLIS